MPAYTYIAQLQRLHIPKIPAECNTLRIQGVGVRGFKLPPPTDTSEFLETKTLSNFFYATY